MVVGRDHDEALALRLAESDEETGVRFLVDHGIRARIAADPVAAHLVGAVVLVDHGVEDGLTVGGPDDIAVRVFDRPVDDRAGRDVADEEAITLRAVEVEGVGEAAVVVTVLAVPDPEIGLALGLAVAVEQQDLCRLVVARGAAEERMLAAFDVAAVVGPCSVWRGHRGVVLLHAPAHLGVERLPERRVGCQEGLGMGVLGLQIGADFGIECIRLAHHPLPVGILEPGVVVAAGDPVQRGRDGPSGRNGGFGDRARTWSSLLGSASGLLTRLAGRNHPARRQRPGDIFAAPRQSIMVRCANRRDRLSREFQPDRHFGARGLPGARRGDSRPYLGEHPALRARLGGDPSAGRWRRSATAISTSSSSCAAQRRALREAGAALRAARRRELAAAAGPRLLRARGAGGARPPRAGAHARRSTASTP